MIINSSNAREYCLAIGQLIPIFLLALYVIDIRWVAKSEAAEKVEGTKKAYIERAIIGIILGVVGEVIVLWGALGLIDRLFAMASGTAIAILISGILGESGIDRLNWQFKGDWAKFLRGFWLVINILAALITLIWTLLTVKVTA